MLNIGQLRDPVEVYRTTATTSGSGATVRTPQLIATEWAKVEAQTGEEFASGTTGVMTATATYKFTIRWPMVAEIHEKDVLKWRGDSYAVQSVEPQMIGLQQVTLIKAKRGSANG